MYTFPLLKWTVTRVNDSGICNSQLHLTFKCSEWLYNWLYVTDNSRSQCRGISKWDWGDIPPPSLHLQEMISFRAFIIPCQRSHMWEILRISTKSMCYFLAITKTKLLIFSLKSHPSCFQYCIRWNCILCKVHFIVMCLALPVKSCLIEVFTNLGLLVEHKTWIPKVAGLNPVPVNAVFAHFIL